MVEMLDFSRAEDARVLCALKPDDSNQTVVREAEEDQEEMVGVSVWKSKSSFGHSTSTTCVVSLSTASAFQTPPATSGSPTTASSSFARTGRRVPTIAPRPSNTTIKRSQRCGSCPILHRDRTEGYDGCS